MICVLSKVEIDKIKVDFYTKMDYNINYEKKQPLFCEKTQLQKMVCVMVCRSAASHAEKAGMDRSTLDTLDFLISDCIIKSD